MNERNEIQTVGPNPYETYGNAATQGRIVGKLLRFTKFGEYVAGQDKERIPHGTQLIAVMPSLMLGWMKWEDEGPPISHMGLVGESYVPPRRDELGDTDKSQWKADDSGKVRDPWQQANTLIMADLNDMDRLFTFSTTSVGGMNAVGELSRVYGKHMKLRPADLPVISLDGTSYRHTKREYGEIRVPVFSITRWINSDTLPQIGNITLDRDSIPF